MSTLQINENLSALATLKNTTPTPKNPIRAARRVNELKLAWSVVNDTYLETGYGGVPNGLWYDIHHLNPRTTCLITTQPHPATMTVAFDSILGLPADTLFRPELDDLRAEGRVLCEFSALASRRPGNKIDIGNLHEMFRAGMLIAKYLEDCTDIIVTVNPRHASYYTRRLQFTQVGEIRNYDKVGGAPAVLMCLDILTVEERYEELENARLSQTLLEFFFRNDSLGSILVDLFWQRYPLDPWVIAHFFHDQKQLLDELSHEQRQWVFSKYPGLSELIDDKSLADEDISRRLMCI